MLNLASVGDQLRKLGLYISTDLSISVHSVLQISWRNYIKAADRVKLVALCERIHRHVLAAQCLAKGISLGNLESAEWLLKCVQNAMNSVDPRGGGLQLSLVFGR